MSDDTRMIIPIIIDELKYILLILFMSAPIDLRIPICFCCPVI